jgi:hypothetical protein
MPTEQLPQDREWEVDVALSRIREYVQDHSLSGKLMWDLFNIGLMARAILTHDYESHDESSISLP